MKDNTKVSGTVSDEVGSDPTAGGPAAKPAVSGVTTAGAAASPYINARLPLDQKEYLDRWAREKYWSTANLMRLLLGAAIVAHGGDIPQSLIDDPPRVEP